MARITELNQEAINQLYWDLHDVEKLIPSYEECTEEQHDIVSDMIELYNKALAKANTSDPDKAFEVAHEQDDAPEMKALMQKLEALKED